MATNGADAEAQPLLAVGTAGSPKSAPLPSAPSLNGTQQMIVSTVAYSFCSGTMLVVNKLAAFHIPAPALIASIQLTFCLIFVLAAHNSKRTTVPTPGKVMSQNPFNFTPAGLLLCRQFHNKWQRFQPKSPEIHLFWGEKLF